MRPVLPTGKEDLGETGMTDSERGGGIYVAQACTEIGSSVLELATGKEDCKGTTLQAPRVKVCFLRSITEPHCVRKSPPRTTG